MTSKYNLLVKKSKQVYRTLVLMLAVGTTTAPATSSKTNRIRSRLQSASCSASNIANSPGRSPERLSEDTQQRHRSTLGIHFLLRVSGGRQAPQIHSTLRVNASNHHHLSLRPGQNDRLSLSLATSIRTPQRYKCGRSPAGICGHSHKLMLPSHHYHRVCANARSYIE